MIVLLYRFFHFCDIIFLMEIIRYRIRTKPYLCLSPAEAINTGITIGEQTVEMVILVKNPGPGYPEYGVIRNMSEEELKKIPVMERGEKVFERRKDAVNYIKTMGSKNYQLCGVKETRALPREELRIDEEKSVEDFLKELKAFEKKNNF
ncbi:MAG: hypothetical protein DRP67_06200 [Candidatus Omnitrophota bacterium]|nr:MAG: hypothetical protein DRP67_06200 [Candidatus Omnitrophota bacterium]